MLKSIVPKLPMRDKEATKAFYAALGFTPLGNRDIFPDYLMLCKDDIEIHFFLFPDLNPEQNDGQVYIRVTDIDQIYQNVLQQKLRMPVGVRLEDKPWKQREFSLLDPDTNLLTFGQSLL
jgi:catechol 2,3-dioxygenase-like lactoylglutathione lyase family enzyme